MRVYLCVSVDSLTCNECKYGLLGFCLSNNQITCATNTSQCSSGKTSRSPPDRLEAHTLSIWTLHVSTGMILLKILPNTVTHCHTHIDQQTPVIYSLNRPACNEVLILSFTVKLKHCISRQMKKKRRGERREEVKGRMLFLWLTSWAYLMLNVEKQWRRVSFQSMLARSSTSKCSQMKYLYLKNVFE